ncbi:hypothetical protein ColTof4_04455 [Colletotrichum tofieldiae]|nr:hypothetical protein ColTof3_11337 [Colletotrichum tofieldiae]GKT72032.1 hypothetical protein ColTof4_04455 [Colletotrichum tofieldiae]
MDFINTPTDQLCAARQPSITSLPSRSNTPPAGADRLKGSEPVTQPGNSFEHVSEDSEIIDNAENDSVIDVDYDGLDALEHRIFKRMYADRKNRLMEIYFSRIGNKVQHGRSRKARKLAQRRRILQDEKKQMD